MSRRLAAISPIGRSTVDPVGEAMPRAQITPGSAPASAGRRQLLALMASTLSGCAVLSPEADPSPSADPPASAGVSIPRFSTAGPGEIPKGWKPWIIHPRKARTEYAVADLQGARVLRARARSSASGLLVPLDADPMEYRRLTWRWRTEGLLHEADNAEASREDAPLRVVLAFEGDRSKLPVRDRLFFERVKLLAGVDMPYATPMANRIAILSISAAPAWIRKAAMALSEPQPFGSSQ